MFFGNGDAKQARAVQVCIILGREFRIAVIGRSTARKDALTKFARLRDDRGLFVAQPKGAWVEDRRVEGDLVHCGCSFADRCRH